MPPGDAINISARRDNPSRCRLEFGLGAGQPLLLKFADARLVGGMRAEECGGTRYCFFGLADKKSFANISAEFSTVFRNVSFAKCFPIVPKWLALSQTVTVAK